MRPSPERVSAGYCLADEDGRCLVYLPRRRAVEVALEHTPGQATWINAQSPADRRPAAPDTSGAFCDGCERCTHCKKWVAPDDGDDWLLYLA